MKYFNNNTRLYLFIFLIILILFKNIATLFGYFFYGTVVIIVVDIIYNFRQKLLSKLISFKLYIVLLAIFILSQFIQTELYNIKEAVAGLAILIIVIYLSLLKLDSKKIYKLFSIVSGVTFFIVIIGLVNYWFFIQGIVFVPFKEGNVNNTLNSDANMFSLSVLIAFILVMFILINEKKNKYLMQFFLLVYEFSILLSGSRRGIIAIILLIVFSFLLYRKYVSLFMYTNVIGILFIIAFFLITPAQRNSLIGGSPVLKKKITNSVYRYGTILNIKSTYLSIQKDLWFDSNVPGNGWGVGGNEFGNIPDTLKKDGHSVGLILDNDIPFTHSPWTSFYRTRLFDDKVLKDDSVIVSLYCLVTKDFSGDKAWLTLRGMKGDNIYYDMSRKNQWQMLLIKGVGANSIGECYFFISKKGVEGFKDMKGSVILYYPEIRHVYSDAEITRSYSAFRTRKGRWKLAFHIFRNEYNLRKMLLGDGFSYQKIFEEKNDLIMDYPHNPILSAFLYSGILGGLLYMYFLGLSFYKYWILRKKFILFAILYVLAFIFVLFSGNSHFSIPVFAFLSLLPFALYERR